MFKKYSSIENTYRQKTIDYISTEGLSGGQWAVSEKIHGGNFSFWYDGTDPIRCGKKTSLIGETENFYGSQKVLADNADKIKALFLLLKETHTFIVMGVYGEIAGGSYPHKDVEKIVGATKVQDGVWYAPFNFFYAFDIALDNILLDDIEVHSVLEKVGIFNGRPLFTGTLQEALLYSNAFQTTIPARFGLPDLENNICEGVVIKPVQPKYFSSGERVILKNKNERWSENTKAPTVKTEVEWTGEGKVVFDAICDCLTENRLRNVISHLGTIDQKGFGKLLGEFTKDALEDYFKDNREAFEKLQKDEQKRITKMLGQVASNVIRPLFLDILDNTF